MDTVWPLRTLPTRFPHWTRERYPSAVIELEKVNDGSLRFWLFVWQCIECAEKARAWQRAMEDGAADSNEAARRMDIEYAGTIHRIVKATRQVAAHMTRYPRQAAWALGYAELAIKAEDKIVPLNTATTTADLVNPFGYGQGTSQDVVARLLDHYADLLEKAPLSKSGPFMHRFQLGALHFEEAVDRRPSRPEAVVTSLLFGLVLFAREYTSEGCASLQFPVKMPREGRPLWPLAVAFLGDALDEHLDEKAAQIRLSGLLSRHPSAGWVEWTDPPERYVDTPDPNTWF
jgi:hypothetical protein